MGIDMEKIVEQGLLYDFYGELLTEHQRKVYEDAVYRDYSLSEIAQEYNISRQGVHDLIKRCNTALQEYEDKLHLIDKFIKIRDKVNQIQDMTHQADSGRDEVMNGIRQLSQDILEEL